MKQTSAYRADIDGLRAVAVLSVVLFHLHVPGFSGGYVGVDIFLVISGYLITGLIQPEMNRQAFSLRTFYLRRVRRLGPALLVMSVPVTVIALLLLYPEDMRSFAASLTTQFVALQNVFFLADGEYFRGSDAKPLLHTWTLAVEEQFYLLWPLLLLLTRRLKLSHQLPLLVAILISSFGLGLVLMPISPKAAFFLLPPRAWELGIGGLLAILQLRTSLEQWLTPRRREVASSVGLVAILVSVIVFTAETPFPGRAALLPALGAALIIAGGVGGTTAVGSLLSRRPLVHVGLISYPLYLWHWPLIAFLHVLHHDPTRPLTAVCLLALSVALAELTTRFVETPVRTRRWFASGRSLIIATGSVAAVLVALGLWWYSDEGAAWRFGPRARAFLTAPLHARSDRCGLLFRALHPRDQVCSMHLEPEPVRKVLVWGNSHADMWSSAFIELAAQHHASTYLNARNCRATVDLEFCSRAVQASVLTFIERERITDVVLASSWYGAYDMRDDEFERALDDVLTRLSSIGVRTWLIVDAPVGKPFDPITAFERDPQNPVLGIISRSDYLAVRDREAALFQRFSRDHARVRVIDLTDTFCDATSCVAGKGPEVWYRDTNHVTDEGARAAEPRFLPVFSD